MTTGEWTIAKVKETLPAIQVLFNKKSYLAHIFGRELPFAGVVFTPAVGKIILPQITVEFAWQTIADALNKNKPLRAS